MDSDVIYKLLRAFADKRVRYVVVGGVALNLQGLARATVDVDIVRRL